MNVLSKQTTRSEAFIKQFNKIQIKKMLGHKRALVNLQKLEPAPP